MARTINATKFGIMGAIVGGLQFKLNEMALRAAEEAEARKEARLAAIREEAAARGEMRANVEWTRRNQIENEQQLDRDDRLTSRQLTIQRDQQAFMSGEKRADREHDFVLEDRRTSNNIRQTREQVAAQGAEQRRSHRDATVFDTEYERRRGGGRNDPTRGKGVLGSDGKTYPFGTALPAGVRPVGGYGVAWAPSESKSQAPGGSRRRERGVGREAMPSATPRFKAPEGAIQMLKNDPSLKPHFDAKYGAGAADFYLGAGE